jgi:undecaprenyl pyrophosphate phosphatase UppP
MKHIQTRSFLPFVTYRILLGGALLLALCTGLIEN